MRKHEVSRRAPHEQEGPGFLAASVLLPALIHPSAKRSRVVLIVDMDEVHARRTAKIVASELWVARAWAVWSGVMQGS